MKTKVKLLLAPMVAIAGLFYYSNQYTPEYKRGLKPEKGCVFMTVMGEQPSRGFNRYKSDQNIHLSVRDGLEWLSNAQLPNGGYGAGSHNAQQIRDPHAVKADPATSAMVGMAFLRSGITLQEGEQAQNLKELVNYIVEIVEKAHVSDPYLTEVRNTQIQTKLGQNIDAVLTAQFLSNLLDRDLAGVDRNRLVRALDICVARVQQETDAYGAQKGAGWAGVLQSGLALSALESAQAAGIEVDTTVLERSKLYQKSNFNEKDGTVKTDDGAGIMLYSVSGSVRGSAKEARKAKLDIEKAKAEGKLAPEAEINTENLQKIGYGRGEAQKYTTSYKVYNAAKQTAQRDEVMNGFGSNGGEEFLSYLQTGESMVVNKDEDWKKWYDNMSGRILKIQNEDGSWNGHHCITSPVFCTATSLLLLTVEEDISFLQKVGE